MELNELKFFLNNSSLYKDKPVDSSNYLIIREKKNILKMFSKYFNKKISYIDKLFLNTRCNFGNCLMILNKILFFCEIIRCKNIILNKNIYWFIKKSITIQKINLSISTKKYKKFNKNSLLIYGSFKIYFYKFIFKPEIRIHWLRDEILSNIPKIAINHNDLYIHIRNGDIFNPVTAHGDYAQPPLCFYRSILKNFKFRKIYIIAWDKNNLLVKKITLLY